MKSEWSQILEEYLMRKGGAAVDTDDAGQSAFGDAMGMTHDAEEDARRAMLLGRVRAWLVNDVLRGSANGVFSLAVEDGLRATPPWVRVRFSMQERLPESLLDDCTLTFSMPGDALVTVPDLRPCFEDPVRSDDLMPSDEEFPDLIDVEDLNREWVAATVHRFVRAALARQ